MIPQALMDLKRWIPESGKKVPVKGWNAPENWMTRKDAKEFQHKRYGRAAFVLTGSKYMVIDFDHVLGDYGQFLSDAAEQMFKALRSFGGYCEKSQSGRGLHIIFLCDEGNVPFSEDLLLTDDGSQHVEIYHGAAKKFSMTGLDFDGGGDFGEHSRACNRIYRDN